MPDEPLSTWPGDAGAAVVQGSTGGLAEDAAAYLAKSASTVESLSGSPKEIRRQGDRLVEWARTRHVLLPADCTATLEKHEGTTSEHEVFYRASDNRAVKRTYPGAYGFANGPNGRTRKATPLFYLERLQLMREVFNDDSRLEGVALASEELPSIVISQEWVDALNAASAHPSEQQIEAFMRSFGFTALADTNFKWRRDSDKLAVFDTKPDNFILASTGIVPIDLLIGREYG